MNIPWMPSEQGVCNGHTAPENPRAADRTLALVPRKGKKRDRGGEVKKMWGEEFVSLFESIEIGVRPSAAGRRLARKKGDQ